LAGGTSETESATSAGWVWLLLRLKASVDFGVDLRNHDEDRTWWHGYSEGSWRDENGLRPAVVRG
jgi:hypothetical protein